MYGYTTIHTESAIPHQGRWEKTLPTHPERGFPAFLPTGDPAKPSVPIPRRSEGSSETLSGCLRHQFKEGRGTKRIHSPGLGASGGGGEGARLGSTT